MPIDLSNRWRIVADWRSGEILYSGSGEWAACKAYEPGTVIGYGDDYAQAEAMCRKYLGMARLAESIGKRVVA